MGCGVRVGWGQGEEQKGKILPETLTPHTASHWTSRIQSQTYHIRTDMRVFIQKKPEAGLCSQNSSTRQGALSWMSFLCDILNKGSAWETRSQSCIISFLGLGQETRNGLEGTLIRSQKQHNELYFSPTRRTRNLLNRNPIWTLYISEQTPCPPPPEQTQCICRPQYSPKQGNVSLPFYQSEFHT